MRKAVSLQRLAAELGLDEPHLALDLSVDNKAAIDLAYNPSTTCI